MKAVLGMFCSLAAVGAALAADTTMKPVPLTAKGSIELSAPAGGLGPITVMAGSKIEQRTALDLTRVGLASDGARLVVRATLASAPPDDIGVEVLRLYLDTDNDPKTGAQLMFPQTPHVGGFEYEARLSLCIKAKDGSEACSGGINGLHADAHFAAANLLRNTGSDGSRQDEVLGLVEFPGRKAATRQPLSGAVAEGSLDYADLGVKPGQTIRIVMRKYGGSPPLDYTGFFEPVLLTLK